MCAARYNIRRLLPRISCGRCLVYLGLAFVGYLGYCVCRIPETIREAYALEWVSGMVVKYMERNDGRWPHDWDDLQEPYEIAAAQGGRPWTFEDLRRRVDVDFSADVNELANAPLKNGRVPFRVISLRSGYFHYWEGMEPNVNIWRYLQKRAKGPATDRDR